jgi:hypothetical protein
VGRAMVDMNTSPTDEATRILTHAPASEGEG